MFDCIREEICRKWPCVRFKPYELILRDKVENEVDEKNEKERVLKMKKGGTQ